MSRHIALVAGIGLAICFASSANAQVQVLGLLARGAAGRAAVGAAAGSLATGGAGAIVGRGGQAFVRNPRAYYYNGAPSVRFAAPTPRYYDSYASYGGGYAQPNGYARAAYYQPTCSTRVQYCPTPYGWVQQVVRVCN